MQARINAEISGSIAHSMAACVNHISHPHSYFINKVHKHHAYTCESAKLPRQRLPRTPGFIPCTYKHLPFVVVVVFFRFFTLYILSLCLVFFFQLSSLSNIRAHGPFNAVAHNIHIRAVDHAELRYNTQIGNREKEWVSQRECEKE